MSDEGLKDREVGYGRPPRATRFAPGRAAILADARREADPLGRS
jgi:hypothetical protein